MKINASLKKRNKQEIVPVIGADDTLYFVFEPTGNLDEYEQLLKKQEKPTKIVKTVGGKEEKIEANKVSSEERAQQYLSFLVVQSLAHIYRLVVAEIKDENGVVGTESQQEEIDFTWETIDLNDLATYPNYEKELYELGVMPYEIRLLIEAALAANSVDEQAVEDARATFLASQHHENK